MQHTGPEFVRHLVGTHEFLAHLVVESAIASTPGFFAADGLTVHGRMLGPLTDERFVTAYANALEPYTDKPEHAVLRGLVWRKAVLYWAVQACATLEGSLVECGTGDGFGVDVIRRALGDELGDRPWFLFDTFEGVPRQLTDPGFIEPHGTGSYESVCALFAGSPNIDVVKGLLPGTIEAAATGPIVFAHVDLNNARSELETIRAIWPRLVAGGILVLDDFGWILFARQHNSLRSLFRRSGIPILELPTGQGVVVKQLGMVLADFDVDEILLDADFQGVPNWEQISCTPTTTPGEEFLTAVQYFEDQKGYLDARSVDLGDDERLAMSTNFNTSPDSHLVVSLPVVCQDISPARLLLQHCIDTLQQRIDSLQEPAPNTEDPS